jgi:hypothetical protein
MMFAYELDAAEALLVPSRYGTAFLAYIHNTYVSGD